MLKSDSWAKALEAPGKLLSLCCFLFSRKKSNLSSCSRKPGPSCYPPLCLTLRCEAFSDADSVQAFLLKSEESAGGVIRWGFCSAVMKLFAVMSLDIFLMA